MVNEMDGRLLAFGSIALVAAAGLVRRGSRVLEAPWAHIEMTDRYHVELGIYRWDAWHEVWENEPEWQEVFSTTRSMEEAEQIIQITQKFSEGVLPAGPKWQKDRSWFEEGGSASRSGLWFSIWDAQEEEFAAQWKLEEYPAMDDVEACRAIFRTIRDAWRRQRVSFRLFGSSF
jgi:hypothetical protein